MTPPLVIFNFPPDLTTIRALWSVAPSTFKTPSLQTTILIVTADIPYPPLMNIKVCDLPNKGL